MYYNVYKKVLQFIYRKVENLMTMYTKDRKTKRKIYMRIDFDIIPCDGLDLTDGQTYSAAIAGMKKAIKELKKERKNEKQKQSKNVQD